MIYYKHIPQDQFNPEAIIESGQVFRLSRDGDGYQAFTGNKAISFKFNEEKDRWMFGTLDDWDWNEYFDLHTDYESYNGIIRSSGDDLLIAALEAIPGMRILKQDLWEAIVTFMVSQNNNIPKIRKTVNLLCERYGEPKVYATWDGQLGTFYTFPSPNQIAALSLEELSNGTMLGYRAKYILQLAIAVDTGEFSLDDLEGLDYGVAIEKLQEVKGIGPKVANCIALYGLHLMEGYPIDTWMRKIMSEDYPQYTQAQYLGYINSTYPRFQGYVQQLQFYYKRITSK